MSIETDPQWASGDPQRWATYWRAIYQITGAPAVVVEEYGRSEKAAAELAEKALAEALEKVIELGLKVEASAWTVKHQSRTQNRSFPRANVKEYVTADWYGRLTQVAKGVLDAEATR